MTPNSHDLTNANPVMRFWTAALDALELTDADLFPGNAPANRARIGIGRFPVVDQVMEKAHELYEAAQ